MGKEADYLALVKEALAPLQAKYGNSAALESRRKNGMALSRLTFANDWSRPLNSALASPSR